MADQVALPCHSRVAARQLPDAGSGACCYGAAVYGADRCTCWSDVYDLAQADPDPNSVRWLAAGVQPNTRSRMCADCAYRPNSPERLRDPGYNGDAEELERIASEDRFWCHQGMRRVVALRHPSGAEVPGHPAAYRPPIAEGIPYQANGRPGELCAGWAARRRALAANPKDPGADHE